MTRLSRRGFTQGAIATGAIAASPLRAAWGQAAPIRIGSLLPRSGFEALIGQDCQQGLDVAKAMLKEMGHSFEVVDADTESKPEVARTQAERLIRDGCHMLMGSFDSGQTFALAQVAEQRGIPLVINIGADPAITEQGYKFVFRNFPTARMFGDNGLGLFAQLFKMTGTNPKTAVLMHVNDTFGEATDKAVYSFRDRVGLPFKILEDIAYSPQTNDLSVEIAKAKAYKADLHMVIHRLNDIIIMVREMVKQRYEPMGIISPGSPGMQFPQFFKSLGKYADYCITNQPWLDPKQALAQRFKTAFYKAYPDGLCGLEQGFMFEGLLVCLDAFKRAKSTKPHELAAALRSTHITDRVMLGGAIGFDAKGQNTNLPSASVQNLKGKPTVVLPPESAEAKPVFPMPGWSKRG
jgi:branched-chain amino acid transport system substrate-binding protein